MFGNSNVTSSWANPQQNPQQQQQQQQHQGSAFGQPNAFGTGTGTAFGSNPFGQNQQQPPPANPMFGNLGGNTTTQPPSTGFGSTPSTFGTNAGFGGIKPATGFGTFGGGGTSTFGSGTSTFGSTNNATGTTSFGQPSNTTGAFGSTNTGTGLFGAKPATTSAFGAAATSTAPDPNASVPPVTTGSSNPPYSPFTEKDNTGPTPVTLHYQSISTMPAYRGTSFEELRVQDYAQGRKSAGGFGQSAVFGMNPSQSNQPATSLFGLSQQQQNQTTTPGFGFGQNTQATTQPSTGFGAFGPSSTAAQPATTGFGANTGGFGTFGQNPQQQQGQPGTTTGFSGFNQNNQQQQGQQPAPGGGLFSGFGTSSQATKPFIGFGTNPTSNTFGAGGGAFGQTNTQQQPTTGIFGQQPNQQQGQTSGGFGSFGTANATKPSIFGTSTTTQQPTSGFGFGTNQQNQQGQQPQQPPGSLFGGTGLFGQNPNQQQQAQQPSLFGSQQQQPGSLFGGGLLGNNNQQQQDANKPAGFGTSLFGTQQNTTNQPTNTGAPSQHSIFSQPPNQPNIQPAVNTGGFGNSWLGQQKPATTGFGQLQQQPASNTFGGSLLGNTMGNTGSGFGVSTNAGQGQLTASIAQPVSTNLPIFSLLPSAPRAVPLDQPPKKASSYFVDVPTRSPLSMSIAPNNLGASKLRGFANSQAISNGRSGNPFSTSLIFSTNHTNGNSILGKAPDKSFLGPDAFLSAKTLGSNGRPSPKKLVLDKKIDPNELFGKSDFKGSGTKVTFNPVMGAAVREREGLANMPSNASKAPPTPSKGKDGFRDSSKDKMKAGADHTELEEGAYWVKPSLEVLRNSSNTELSAMKGLVVGRVGFGEVQFLEPVDLTTLPRLASLLGKVIQIDSKECCVYPESDDGDDSKPQPGEGLNVRARIVLLGCWPLDKATREPIKDEKHQAFAKHLKRLKSIKHTHFEGYDIAEGKWTFTVEHF